MAMKMDEAKTRAGVLKALSNPIRLMVVDELSRGDRCVSELLRLFRIRQPTLSRHLSVIKAAGMVSERYRGRWVVYHLEAKSAVRILNNVREVLAVDGAKKSRAS